MDLPVIDRDVTLEDNATYYFAGFSLRKCLRKFNCDNCPNTLADNDTEAISQYQILQFFKAYPTKDDNNPLSLGNLTAPTEEYWNVVSFQLKAFSKLYSLIRHEHHLINKLLDYIIEETSQTYPSWFTDDCRDHRIFMLRSLLITRVAYGFKWLSEDSRQTKRQRSGKKANTNNVALKKFRFL